MRVYVPTTLSALAEHVGAGVVPDSAERFTAEDDEQAEYDALLAAAAASADLLGGPGRRVVVVAETPDLAGDLPMSHVVAVHADATDQWDADDDLGWYASQEIADLLRVDLL